MRILSTYLLVTAAASLLGLSSADADVNSTVDVDLTPCIFSDGTVMPDTAGVSEAYLLGQFFRGFWGSTQIEADAANVGFNLENELQHSDRHGKCNAVFVGFGPSADQYATLRTYSETFKVRIVYMMVTAADLVASQRLGVGSQFREPFMDMVEQKMLIEGIKLKDSTSRLINPSLLTAPKEMNIYTYPMVIMNDAPDGVTTVVADYTDAEGTTLALNITYNEGEDNEYVHSYPSAAAVTYTNEAGLEEMHMFFHMAWFDTGSWAWGHYVVEWATKGVFQGERRFWLGAQVDDHFLDTNVFEWDGDTNAGATTERISAEDMEALLSGTADLNAVYNSEIITEFPFNGFGVLKQAESAYRYTFEDSDAALLPKGDAPKVYDGELGRPTMVEPAGWWSMNTLTGMEAEFAEGKWNESDPLLKASLDMIDDFHWQSHTMSHLSRDDLGETDCTMEDGANAWLAVITGMFERDTYNWRSMTNPGITGLFNKNCLESAINNLITCAPGDNTYIGGDVTPVSLISDVSQFHSIYTTEEGNGHAGFQIVPRFATYIYYNCRTTECLVRENLYIRRVTCGCFNTNPLTEDGDYNLDMDGCDMVECKPHGIEAENWEPEFQAFAEDVEIGGGESLFGTEAKTTARHLLTGRRDKYMVHQANVVRTDDTPMLGDMSFESISLLEYWYRVVLEELSGYMNIKGSADPFPVRSVKFDDLCTNFRDHEDLDASGSVVTMTKTMVGEITNMRLSSSTGKDAGVVPVTFPTTTANALPTDESGMPVWDMPVYKTEEYGSDTTYYASTSGDAPELPDKPTKDDLPLPEAQGSDDPSASSKDGSDQDAPSPSGSDASSPSDSEASPPSVSADPSSPSDSGSSSGPEICQARINRKLGLKKKRGAD